MTTCRSAQPAGPRRRVAPTRRSFARRGDDRRSIAPALRRFGFRPAGHTAARRPAEPVEPLEILRIGSATLIRGDALRVMPRLEQRFAAVLADPPYSSGGLFRGDRVAPPSEKYQRGEYRKLHPEFSGDNRDQRSFLLWSVLWMERALARLEPGGILGAFSDWRQYPVTSDALQVAGAIWRGVVVWDKTEACRPQLGRYRMQTEFFLWGTQGPRALRGPVGRGVVRQAVGEKFHMAGKPVDLMTQLLAVVDGPVLDPFMGSGSVGLACLARELPYVGIELDKGSFDVACARMRAAA